MEKNIEQLQGILDKLIPYSKHYLTVEATVKNDMVHVTWSNPKDWKWHFEDVEFPIADIDHRIIHYTNKLNYAIQKAKEVAAC